MRDLDRRLRLLESWAKPGGCLECEFAKLNARHRGDDPPEGRCSHPRSLTLMDVLASIESSPRSKIGPAGTSGAWKS